MKGGEFSCINIHTPAQGGGLTGVRERKEKEGETRGRPVGSREQESV